MDNERHYYVYIVASLSRRIYVGVTHTLFHRVRQHKEGLVPGFTQKYRMNRLVYFESFRYIKAAIAREKEIKGWRRSKKVSIIEASNPTWADLSLEVVMRKQQEQVPRAQIGPRDDNQIKLPRNSGQRI